ncbi:hypothetical protein RUM44_010312 [Polyplax serrata]|uniref:Peptidase S1 domain-containing protein n=1 Tax=Polyplax serrata TaxID=468196 RepID=A0ABR1AWP8_POLSC
MTAGWLILTTAVLFTLDVTTTTGQVFSKNDSKVFFGWFQRTTTPSTVVQPYLRTCSCSCGLQKDETRIVGGKETEIHEYPWMVRLTYLNTFYCGGMLINDRYVLTAAHCVKGHLWFLIKVTLGEHNRCNSTFRPEARFVLRAFQGKFSFLNFENDIALLRLNDRVPINDHIRPICLPLRTDNLYTDVVATATGWGTLKEDGIPSCSLQKVNLRVMSNQECRNSNYEESLISDKMMCAGDVLGGKDTCQGDSGGPLAYRREDNKFELIGIVSWGSGCGRMGYPGVYTRITHYLNWIIDNSKDACYCQN